MISILNIQNYVRPATLEEAWTLNQKKANRIIGGMMWLRMGSQTINTAIDLTGLALDTIEERDDAFVIGAMVTERQLETSEPLKNAFGGVLAASVEHIVGVQFRNMATIGGSVWSRAGYSDILTALLALNARVVLYKGGEMPLERFMTMKPDRDILVSVILPKGEISAAYQSVRLNRTDFPLLTCAAVRDGSSVRVAVGARPMRAMLIPDPNGLLKAPLTSASIRAFAAWAKDAVPVGSNYRGSAAYRRRLVSAVITRALTEIGGDQA